ncbi:MAG: hypothetical protein ACUVQH_15210 [Thermogutta sp.]
MTKALAFLCLLVTLTGLSLGCKKSPQSNVQAPARAEAVEDLKQLLPPPDAKGRLGNPKPAATNP